MQRPAPQTTPTHMLVSTAPSDMGAARSARVGPIVRRGPAVVAPIYASPRRNQGHASTRHRPVSPAESTSSASSNGTCRYFSRDSDASTSSSPALSASSPSPSSPTSTISPVAGPSKTRRRSAQDTLRRINLAHGKRLNALAKQTFDMLKSSPATPRRKRSLSTSSGNWRLSGAERIDRVAEGMVKSDGKMDIEAWWDNLDEELKQRSQPEAELQHPRPKRLFQRAELQDNEQARDMPIEIETGRVTLKKESTASPLGLARHGSSPLRKVAVLP